MDEEIRTHNGSFLYPHPVSVSPNFCFAPEANTRSFQAILAGRDVVTAKFVDVLYGLRNRKVGFCSRMNLERRATRARDDLGGSDGEREDISIVYFELFSHTHTDVEYRKAHHRQLCAV